MGTKQSTTSAVNERSDTRSSGPHSSHVANGADTNGVLSLDPRIRTRSLSSVDRPTSIPVHGSSIQESDLSSSAEDNSPTIRTNFMIQGAQSLPAQLFATSFITGLKCPVCAKVVLPQDIELHLVICLTKPRLSYNEDVLQEDKGECTICLDDLSTEENSVFNLCIKTLKNKRRIIGPLDMFWKVGDNCKTTMSMYISQKMHRSVVSKKPDLPRAPFLVINKALSE